MPAIMTSRQSAELDHAFERNGWTAEDVKKLSEGNHLGLVLDYLHGRARIVEINAVAKPRTRRIFRDESLVLDALDGTRTIAESKDVFKAGIDSDFKNWGLNKKGKSTVEMPVEVHEMIDDGMFTQIYGSMFGAYLKDNADSNERKRFIEEHCADLRKLCMKSDDQIINFCEKFPEKLRKDGYGTFFLLEDEETGNFFVASVDFGGDGTLDADVFRLERGSVWDAEDRRRFVIPQQD